MKTPQQLHTPVLLSETISLLNPKQGESYLDLTAGYGGHASEIVSYTNEPKKAVLVDRDEYAIRELQKKCGLANAKIVHSDYLTAAKNLLENNAKFDLILMDIGVSSVQFDQAERGFSFQAEAPLDMRMDSRQENSAYHVVNYESEKQLAKIIHEYGEESPKQAGRIAYAIRTNRPIRTTVQLADVIKKVSPKQGKIHPATRTFQAIRIHVNDELGQLREALPIAVKLLNSGGRIGVISFHSLEDKIVKSYFKEESQAGYEASIELINKKPITASNNEIDYNPRSRSAKLRGAVKK